jgi:hypothetical protein
LRSWLQIADDYYTATVMDMARKDIRETPKDPDDLAHLLLVFEWLRAELEKLTIEAAPASLPDFVPRDSPGMQAIRADFDTLVAACEQDMRQAGISGPVPQRNQESNKVEPPTPQFQLPGHQFEIWASVGLCQDRQPGFLLDAEQLPALLARAQTQFQRASAILAKKPLVRSCVGWANGEVACDKGGYPVFKKERLAHWLADCCRHLCDSQNQPPDIPQRPDGGPSLNPEHWSIWAACDESLWAWRQVFRMAEISRMTRAGRIIRPAYETVPLLRSLEPNLAVYRGLGVPVFRARRGQVLVAGKVLDLAQLCLVADCEKRGFLNHGRVIPLETAAAELCARAAEASVGVGTSFEIEQGMNPSRRWVGLAGALLETVPLGLPDRFIAAVLRHEYRLELTEPELLRYRRTIQEIVNELWSVTQDGTFDLITQRLELTATEGVRRLMKPEFPEVAGRTLVNDLQRRRNRKPVMRLLEEADSKLRSGTAPAARNQLYQQRALTLGGRVTCLGMTAAVRRQELRMAREEVMLAGDEFVLEIEATKTSRKELRKIALLVHEAPRCILGGLAPSVLVDVVAHW